VEPAAEKPAHQRVDDSVREERRPGALHHTQRRARARSGAVCGHGLSPPRSRATRPAVRLLRGRSQISSRGQLERHLRRMRPIYRHRRDVLIAALARHLPELTPAGTSAGLHLLTWLPTGRSEEALVQSPRLPGSALTAWASDVSRPKVEVGSSSVMGQSRSQRSKQALGGSRTSMRGAEMGPPDSKRRECTGRADPADYRGREPYQARCMR
jgi:hypothetical protein